MSPLQQIQEVVHAYGNQPYQEYGEEQSAPFDHALTLAELLDLTPVEWEYKVLPLIEKYVPPTYALYQCLSERIGKSISPRAGWIWCEEVIQHGFVPCLDKRIWSNHGLPASVILYQREHGTKRVYLQVLLDGTGILYTSKRNYPIRSWSELEIQIAALPVIEKQEKKQKELKIAA